MGAFDPAIHELDAQGFQRHKETGHLVGIEQAPARKMENHGAEYPKWVTPHPGHIHHHPLSGITTPEWGIPHVERGTNEVTVMVNDAEEEARALAEPKSSAPTPEAA